LLPTYQIKGEQNGRTTDKITNLPPINDYHLPSKDWSNPEEASLYQKTQVPALHWTAQLMLLQ
jgi:hypothetical protein